MRLFQMIYVSDVTEAMDRQSLENMLEQCRRNNTPAGITGLLIQSGGQYIQLLEGYRVPLETLYAKILRDSRHTNQQQLLLEPAGRRFFPDSSMGLLSVNEISPLDRTRLKALTDRAIRSATDGPELLNFLRGFGKLLPASEKTNAA